MPEKGKNLLVLFVLMLAPWFALFLLLEIMRGPTGPDAASGWPKFWLMLLLAFAILAYEKWFIEVTRAAVLNEGGSSPYTFSDNFLHKADDTALETALGEWATSRTADKKAAVLKQVQADDNEAFKRLTQVIDKLQTRIGEEYTDIASRTGWLVTGQAFLLAAFVTVLNAERLAATAKQWLSIGIGLAGAAITFVLALSIFYGAALVEALKDPRDKAELLAETEFRVPKTGIARTQPVHTFAHYATRYIPCIAYVAWVALTLLAIEQSFGRNAPAGMTLMFPPADLAVSGRGWTAFESSPAFAIGAAKLEESIPGCPDPAQLQQQAQAWLSRVVTQWKTRGSASSSDVLILVGGADRLTLGGTLKRQYDTNMGLARNRAEAIKTMLLAATAAEPADHRLSPNRVLVLVTGPQYLPKADGTTQQRAENCNDPTLAEDRRVQVWLPSGG